MHCSFRQVSTEPPLSCRIISCHATEVTVDCLISPKVVFTWNGTSIRLEATARCSAVDMKKVDIVNLPKLCCRATPSCVTSNIHILHWKALPYTEKCHDVEVAELASEVISIINCFHEIEATGCTPVCGAAAEGFRSSQSLPVRIPVWCVVIDGCILQKCLDFKMRQIL